MRDLFLLTVSAKDEFYHGMVHSRVEKGIHRDTRSLNDKYSHDELMVMQTQDLAYLRMKKGIDARKAEKLRAELSLALQNEENQGEQSEISDDDEIEAQSKPKKRARHIVFVDEEEEVKQFNPSTYLKVPEELLHTGRRELWLTSDQLNDPSLLRGMNDTSAKSSKKRRVEQQNGEDDDEEEGEARRLKRREARLEKKRFRKASKLAQRRVSELRQREEREGKLKNMCADMALKRELTKGGPVRKITPKDKNGDKGKPYYVWKGVRQR